jgi:hypothetical protein
MYDTSNDVSESEKKREDTRKTVDEQNMTRILAMQQGLLAVVANQREPITSKSDAAKLFEFA